MSSKVGCTRHPLGVWASTNQSATGWTGDLLKCLQSELCNFIHLQFAVPHVGGTWRDGWVGRSLRQGWLPCQVGTVCLLGAASCFLSDSLPGWHNHSRRN